MKRIFFIFLSFCLCVCSLNIQKVQADELNYSVVNVNTDTVLGSYATYSVAYTNMTSMKSSNGSISYGIKYNDKLIQCDYAVARITEYFTYKEADSNRDGYISGTSATDAAYISTSSDGSTIRIKVAGQVMDVSTSYITNLVVSSKTDIKSYYMNVNGYMMHYYYTYSSGKESLASIRVGKSYSYFSGSNKYYSYDGHYFYSNYNTMIDDYRSGNYNHAINAGSPYYNYFQYLPQRAISSVTGADIDSYIVSKIGSSANSVMYNSGTAFVNQGSIYGVNALAMFGLALYESGYGRSAYALNNNNLFGHGAYDKTPAATVYETVEDCIAYHASTYLSAGYLNAADSRYRGSHYGDKQSGMNVKYASTAYWGEVAASIGYYLGDDYGKYTLGIVNGDVKVYNSPSSSSTVLYSTGCTGSSNNVNNVPVIVLDTVTGSDGNQYYKIMSDTVLNSARTAIEPKGIYDYSRDYGYILKSQVYIANSSSGGSTTPTEPAKPTSYVPKGTVDAITSTEAGTISVAGWAFDQDDLSQNLVIKVYIGYTCLGTLSANQTRDDVNSAYGITGKHGFSGNVTTSLSGSQTVVVKAVDLYTSSEYTIGTKTITIEKAYSKNYLPQGCLDACFSPAANQGYVSGWAFDKDDVSESISIKIYVDGSTYSIITANQTRDDVNSAYSITGKHGFSTYLDLSAGSHTISIYMIDLGTGNEKLLATKTIEVISSAVTFNTVSLLLSGQIGIKFYVTLQDEAKTSDAYMKFVIDDEEQIVYLKDASIDTKGRYEFIAYVNSIQMADTVQATYYYNSQASKTITYSVQKYIEQVVNNSSSYSNEIVSLVKAMADYGYYAQMYFSKTKGWTIGQEHVQMTNYSTLGTSMFLEAYKPVINTNSTGLTVSTYNLDLDSAVTMKIYISKGSYSGTPVFKVDGVNATYTYDSSTNRYCVVISNIAAHNLKHMYSITVNGEELIEVSAMSYARSILNSSSASTEMKQLMVAFYYYNYTTLNYRNSI